MKRFPWLLAILLFAMWLLLNNSVSAAHVGLAALLALGVAALSRRMRPLVPHVRRLHAALGLMARVIADIVRSNLHVARIVLGIAGDDVRSGFLDVPLELRDPHGLAILGIIVTATPGTVWVGLTADGTSLQLHVLDLRHPDALIATIKQRYERALLEIFA